MARWCPSATVLLSAALVATALVSLALLQLASPPLPKYPPCLFVDLGAGVGNTFRNFLDSSFNVTEELLPPGVSPDACEIHLFEANPAHTEYLRTLARTYLSTSLRLFVHPETAAWVVDGPINFFLDKVNARENFWGSSLEAAHPDVVASGHETALVTGVDLARWLKVTVSSHPWVVVKMDIEGSEMAVVQHLMRNGAHHLIDILLIEFHPDVPYRSQAGDLTRQEMVDVLKSEGVLVPSFFTST